MPTRSPFEERPIYNAVNVYRERGNYLQRLELFDKSIDAYNEALRWNGSDIRSLLGRGSVRSKARNYTGAMADVARASELEPNNTEVLQRRAETEYSRCAFEHALVLAYRGQDIRKFPPCFAECARYSDQTLKDCLGGAASKVLQSAQKILTNIEMQTLYEHVRNVKTRRPRIQFQHKPEVKEISRTEKQKAERVSRAMAFQYLGQMAHDKFFLNSLCKDDRLFSANQQGSQELLRLAKKALADIESRQEVLHERCPLYAVRAPVLAARARLAVTRKEQLKNTQELNAIDARRVINAALAEEHDTARCIELAEFALDQINKKPAKLLPGKDKYLDEVHNIVANAFLDQKRVQDTMSESDREKRAFILLGMAVSREPSRDSVLRVRPPALRRDHKTRRQILERALSLNTRNSERCYILHELARLHIDTKHVLKARSFATRCKSEARDGNLRVWLLNALFLLARCHLLQNNRPEARATLIEAAGHARAGGYHDVAEFFDTCVNISLEGDVLHAEAPLEQRQKDMVGLMQDPDMRSAATILFKKMSVMPAERRFSVLPGARSDMQGPVMPMAERRRMSIAGKVPQPTTIKHKINHPLGYQNFDFM